MRLIDLTCPHCGAPLQVEEGKKLLVCQHCGSMLLLDDETQKVQIIDAEQAGYEFEKGRQRALEEKAAGERAAKEKALEDTSAEWDSIRRIEEENAGSSTPGEQAPKRRHGNRLVIAFVLIVVYLLIMGVLTTRVQKDDTGTAAGAASSYSSRKKTTTASAGKTTAGAGRSGHASKGYTSGKAADDKAASAAGSVSTEKNLEESAASGSTSAEDTSQESITAGSASSADAAAEAAEALVTASSPDELSAASETALLEAAEGEESGAVETSETAASDLEDSSEKTAGEEVLSASDIRKKTEAAVGGHYDESLKGHGFADYGRDEPNYINVIGYVTVSSSEEVDLYRTDDFANEDLWVVPTYEQDKQFWNETGTIPHKTEVVVREQILNHEGYGAYSGYLLVERTDDHSRCYIDVSNFITKPYWTYPDLVDAVKEGPYVAVYHQASNYWPTTDGEEKEELPDGILVYVQRKATAHRSINPAETDLEAVVWKQWKYGYGGVNVCFNHEDLTLVY